MEAFLDLVPRHDRETYDIPGGEERLVRLIASGPVPAALLLRLARETAFPGTALLEQAVASASGDEGLFAAGRSGTVVKRPDGSVRRSVGTEPDADSLLTVLEKGISSVQEELGERREGQAEMARTVMTALVQGEISFVEAGTGTGKSLAYLIPAALFSSATGERVVISTHTKNLQQQLLDRELPTMRDLTGLEIPVERLMGRENYICSRRLVSKVVKISGDDAAGALRLGLAAALAGEGAAESIPAWLRPFPVRSISAPGRCLMKACPHAATCPLLKARKRGAQASILLVNHALLMTDYRQGGTVLGPYSRVIFDEAHHLERCVMDNLSITITRKTLERIFEQVEPVSPGSERWRLFASQLAATGTGEPGIWSTRVQDLSSKKERLETAFASVFEAAASLRSAGAPGTRTRYQGGEFSGHKNTFSQFYLINKDLRESLKLFCETDAPQSVAAIQNELRYVCEELEGLGEAVRYLEDGSDPDGVFWIEWTASGGVSAVCGSPLEIDRRFADYLEDKTDTAVFTSATLTENGTFDYIMTRLGVGLTGKDPVNLVAGSPFDYESNLLIMRTGGIADPNEDSFASDVASMISMLSESTGRRVMALFTSYRMCIATGEDLEESGFDGTVLIQGRGMGREELAATFRATPGSVLLGVASFWEGVDFPGGELEILVIPKLPFPVPTEPVIEARSERMVLDGGNPFVSLSLPEAILRLRQGVGRLIRRKDDRGVAVLMDPRLGTKSYGPVVLSSLPVEARQAASAEEAARSAEGWFDGG